MSEATIRDHLKINLHLLEKGLRLIKDEYHLRNPNGADGFLDLFAVDARGDLVIIEIKKTDAAARQALTEVSKYAALLKFHKGIKESEFRIMIVSAAWHELLVPYSEFFGATNYRLSAFHISLDGVDTPVSAKEIHPLPAVETRNICRRHFIWEFKSEVKLKAVKAQAEQFFAKIGIHDYLLCIAKFGKPVDGIACMLYFAQQLKPKEFYLDIIRKTHSSEEAQEKIEYIEELVEESDQIDEAADGCWDNHKILGDGAQISHPEKFVQWHISGHWESLTIERHGVFARDERLTDELLIEDLKGTTGASFSHFFAAFLLTNKAKLNEVRTQLENPLFNNDEWRHKIADILMYAEKKKSLSMMLHIFNTSDIIETIWAASAEPASYTPVFMLVLEGNNEVEVFRGRIGWNGADADLSALLKQFFDGQAGTYFLERHFGENRSKNVDVMGMLGFAWRVDYLRLFKNAKSEQSNIVIRGVQISSVADTYAKDFGEFLSARSGLQTQILEMYQQQHIGGGTFQF